MTLPDWSGLARAGEFDGAYLRLQSLEADPAASPLAPPARQELQFAL